jgi:CMP-N,N'-diacetyllegionaminic acid synthase
VIAGLQTLGLIPARGGSKGVPRKNLRLLGGKPLLAWTAAAARGSRYLDRVVLSTDDADIAAAGKDMGLDVPFIRPGSLSSDTALAIDVIRHALELLPGFPLLAYLEPTSPLRTSEDIDRSLELLIESGADACVGVREATEIPDWMFYAGDDHRLEPILGSFDPPQRQRSRPAVSLNGCIYVARTTALLASGSFLGPRTIGYEMPPERSIDLDSLADFEAAERIVAQRT